MDQSNQVAEIKERIDIVSIIEKYVQLKRSGKNLSGLCPFHKEKTPSFMVSPEIQRYKCFGCGASGDVFNFVQNIEHIDFPEALEKLAKVAGIELKKGKPNYQYKAITEINHIATKYFYNQLRKNKEAWEYLVKERDINEESIKRFAIGYAPRTQGLLVKIKASGTYTKKDLLESGLFVEKEGALREKFYDRIMFPIRSKKGKVIGFTGRVLRKDAYGPKYMNTPETPVFHKSYNLFAQYESRQEIRKQDLAIICEGSTDVISAHQHGIKNIVAPLGTSLTTEQLEGLLPLTRNVLLFFDSDNAGQNALIRSFVLVSRLDMNPFAESAEPYKDIDEMLRKDKKKFDSLISNKKEAFSFILARVILDKNLTKLEDLNSIVKTIYPLIDSVKNPNSKALYIRKLKEITKIEYKEGKKSYSTEKGKMPSKSQFHRRLTDSNLLLRYLQLLLFIKEIKSEYLIDKKYFTDERLQKVYNLIQVNYSNFTKEKLYAELESDNVAKALLEDMIFSAKDLSDGESDIKSEVDNLQKKIKLEYYKSKQKQLTGKIAMAEELSDDSESAKLLEKLQKISKIITKIENE